MLEMNKVMLIGNLTRDPELSYLTSGMALAKLGLAVNRRFQNKSGEDQEEVAFVDIDIWGKRAEWASKWIKKGTRVYVEGRLRFHSWEAQDGSKRSKLSVTAERVEYALPKSQNDQQSGGGYQSQGQSGGGGYGNAPQNASQQAAPPQAAPPQASPPEAFAPPQQDAGGAPPQGDNTADDLPF